MKNHGCYFSSPILPHASMASFQPIFYWFAFWFCCCLASVRARPHPCEVRLSIQTVRAFNVAHRGANGELPEETAPAYLRAIEEGTDFIETDILSTKDGVLICFHDVTLNDTTDIADHPEFADRISTYEVQGVDTTGWFSVDFTWQELQTLRTRQRFSFRDSAYNDIFPIIKFEEYIEIALNASRIVGIYPELKNPVFINEHVTWADGKKYEDVFAETLLKYGYQGKFLSEQWKAKPIFIQSFAPTSLIYVSNLTDSPKILLIDDVDIPTQDTNQSFWEITSEAYLNYIKEYVVGIGPWKDTLVPPDTMNHLKNSTHLVHRAHSHGLQVHPYTFRNENQFLHFDFNQDPYQEYQFWISIMKVDGIFTDFPGSLHMYQEWTSPMKLVMGPSAVTWLDTFSKLLFSHKYKLP
ncbi:hypothetical protein GOP47_0014023 [Adiantum capillus-veneris]|uniref:glycerophosphodiester phosphodiesterase n=1 Tax=Adiantum capillus-veneris TaxID=13818 RepID=A0A9D4UNS7_ADICA|nr:hypothetical protein GOP47_0013275 [Adiantum capillus-veneris]KAI5071772.1 hypothetical protein GOP47_0014023 [Adiantum capillus-veneris]